MFVARSTWNPIWRFPLTKVDISVYSSWWQCLNLSFSFENFLIGSSHFIIVLESKLWFFAIINLMILSSSIILLDYIKDSSYNNSKKTFLQWFRVRCHACILTWFWNIGPIIFFYCLKLSLDMSLLLKSYAGFVFCAASFYLSYLWEKVFDFLQVAFFQKCMICHCLLCHALVKCFSLSFLNLRAFVPFQIRKTFHEIYLIAPSVGVWS